MLNDSRAWASFKATLRGRIAGHRRHRALRKLAQYCRTYLAFYDNQDYDMARNGELAVLESLRSPDMRVIFDVGASSGEWSQWALDTHPAAAIHAFEIVEATGQLLARRFSTNARVTTNPFGLSDESATVELRTYQGRSDISTIYSYPEQPEACILQTGRVMTGDDYLVTRGIQSIDFLKIDVEGAELRVLKGFRRALAAGVIAAIQFEYGPINIMAGVLLKDLYSLLTAFGFTIGKIFPTYVDFRPYALRDEDFHGPNYLAVRADRTDMLRRLGTLVRDRRVE